MKQILVLTETRVDESKLKHWGFDGKPDEFFQISRVDHWVVNTFPDETPVIVKLPYTPENIPIFRALSRRKAPWGLHRTQCLPHLPSWKLRLRDWIPPAVFGIRHADFVICAGTEGAKHPLIGENTARLWTCAPDVFRLSEMTEIPPHPKPYAVFLDEANDMPHPDYTNGMKPPNHVAYCSELFDIFDSIEKETQLPIIIAAHPQRRDYVAPWRINYQGMTPNLVAHADLVIAHSSTALSFAVMMKKNIKLVIPPCLIGRPEQRNIEAMGQALAKGCGDYMERYLATSACFGNRRTVQEATESYFNGA